MVATVVNYDRNIKNNQVSNLVVRNVLANMDKIIAIATNAQKSKTYASGALLCNLTASSLANVVEITESILAVNDGGVKNLK